MCLQWKGSMTPSPLLETQWEQTMGWGSARGKIEKINGNISPHLSPGTETRIDGAMAIVFQTWQVGGFIIIISLSPIIIIWQVGGGTTNVPTLTWPASTLTEGHALIVTNKSSIVTEEREGTVMTVGQKPRCCFCPTDLLFPLSSWSDHCQGLIWNQIQCNYVIKSKTAWKQ